MNDPILFAEQKSHFHCQFEAANILSTCDESGLVLSPSHESMLHLKEVLKASLIDAVNDVAARAAVGGA